MPALPLRVLLVLASAALLPLSAAAQSHGHTLAPGDTVRVLARAWGTRMVEGELVVYRTDSLAVRETATGTRYAVPLAGVGRLLKNEGLDRRRSVRRSAVAGLFVGIAVGVVSGPLIAMSRDDENFAGTTLLTGLGGGALGIGVGAASGSVFAREHWQPFRTPILPPSPASTAPAVSIRIPVR